MMRALLKGASQKTKRALADMTNYPFEQPTEIDESQAEASDRSQHRSGSSSPNATFLMTLKLSGLPLQGRRRGTSLWSQRTTLPFTRYGEPCLVQGKRGVQVIIRSVEVWLPVHQWVPIGSQILTVPSRGSLDDMNRFQGQRQRDLC